MQLKMDCNTMAQSGSTSPGVQVNVTLHVTSLCNDCTSEIVRALARHQHCSYAHCSYSGCSSPISANVPSIAVSDTDSQEGATSFGKS